METTSFTIRLKYLSLTQKVIGVAAFLLLISSVLPWYSDIDKFKTGVQFLGITGPLYLMGILVFLAGAIVLGLIVMKLLGKNYIKLPFKDEQIIVFSGALSLGLLILAASVFFHSKFGINVSQKSAGIGLLLGFISSAIVLLGGIYDLKGGAKQSQTSLHKESLIEMGLEDRSQKKIEIQEPQPEVTEKVADSNVPNRPDNAYSANRQNVNAGAEGFRTPYQQSMPDSYFSNDQRYKK